ncbi:MAG: retroviral-like aspartic protease family protein [Candidatus Eremiobacteraeota bacterium]|nr:retroviral-like aspartic protease family protein [Candidatus Eremiobacteraeota bacterium]
MSAARRAALMLAALLLATPAFARAADPVPTAAEIRAHVGAAEREPSAYRETIVTTSSDGTTTTERHLVRGTDERTIDDSPPFHAENGIVHGAHWLQDENGVTIDDRLDPGQAKPETLTTTVTRVRAPVDAYAVATLNAKGWGRKEYVDPVSWHVVRRERILGTGTVTTTYDDFRDDGGRVFAHHWHVDNTVAQTKSDSRVTEFTPGRVGDAELERPPSRRALVAFPEGVSSAELPADFAEHVYVAVRIGDTTVDFVLDTGASGIVVDANVARRIGLRLYGEHSHVVAGRATYARAVVPELRAGALTMRDLVVGVVPLGWTGKRGGRIGGLLGFDFLAQLGVTIDYEHQRVTAVPSSAYVAPFGAQTVALAARFGRGIPLVTVSFDGAVAERVGLDTGGSGSFLMFDYFTRRNPNALHDDDGGVYSEGPEQIGVGGAFATKPAFVHTLELGTLHVPSVLGYRVTSAGSYTTEMDGVIGDKVLRWFTVGFDYAHERIYLTPNAAGRAKLGQSF